MQSLRFAAVVLVAVTAACASTEDSTSTVPTVTASTSPAITPDTAVFDTSPPTSSAATTSAPSTTTTSTTTSTTTTSTTTSTTTTSTTTTLPEPVVGDPAAYDLDATSIILGNSVEGRPIIAERFGTQGGRRVLIIGVIHGNEDAGVQVVDELRARSLAGTGPDGVELWLIESMNPDGQEVQDRHNANEVDLNRNFPLRWGPIGIPGDSQFAGPGPASEPETQVMVAFISQLRPDLAIWYHQDANLIIPSSGRDGRIRARYAELSGLPVADCCDGGIYTGIAATWARDELSDQEGVAFIVELPGGVLTAEQVIRHADTVSTIAIEAGDL